MAEAMNSECILKNTESNAESREQRAESREQRAVKGARRGKKPSCRWCGAPTCTWPSTTGRGTTSSEASLDARWQVTLIRRI